MTDVQPTPADRQRERVARRQKTAKQPDKVGPPRQRRPALAALAVALIVGGALVAGLLAVRLDSRETAYAVRDDVNIAAGQPLTMADLKEVQVSADDLRLVTDDVADGQIRPGGVYARVPIRGGTLLDVDMLTRDQPVDEDRAVVSVPLTADLTPGESQLQIGDLVQVVRTSGGEQVPAELTQAVVLAIESSSNLNDPTATGSLVLEVPQEASLVVIDAATNDRAGVALLRRGVPEDYELVVGNTEPVPGVSTGSDDETP
ncbi:hypothetical protein ABFT23_20395 [Nocardioides sp. C4-1]|uniref:hypothetical protein n=1 Tax=Nocardioides sp. C4-1 TaxID=3151851 RepID=UPI003267ED8B